MRPSVVDPTRLFLALYYLYFNLPYLPLDKSGDAAHLSGLLDPQAGLYADRGLSPWSEGLLGCTETTENERFNLTKTPSKRDTDKSFCKET
jgi:hypothetical protein